jgi:glycine cleavage system regulatory protein
MFLANIIVFRFSCEAWLDIFKTVGDLEREENIEIRDLKCHAQEKNQKEQDVFIINILKLYSYLGSALCAVFSLIIVNI